MTFRRLRWALVTCTPLLGLAGCGPRWRPVSLTPQGALEPRQQVQVWTDAGQVIRLHGVTWTSDSLRGVAYLAPLDSADAGISVARSQIDSLRTGNPPAGFWRSFGLVMAVGFVVGLYGGLAAM